MVTTSSPNCQDNKTYYTKQQIEQTKQARELYHSLGVPSLQDFKALINMNVIKIIQSLLST